MSDNVSKIDTFRLVVLLGEKYKALRFTVKKDKEDQQIFIFEMLKEIYLGYFWMNEDYKHCPEAVIHTHSGLFKEIKQAFFCFFFFFKFYFDTKALVDEITARQLSLWIIVGLLLITDLDSFHCSVSAAKRQLLFIHQSLHPVRGSRWRCGSVCLQPPLCLSVLTGRCRCEVLLSRISMLTSEEER